MTVQQPHYKIYSKSDLDLTGSKYRLIKYKKGLLSCFLTINLIWSDHSHIYGKPTFIGHLVFRAATDGWEGFTETGYNNHFFDHCHDEPLQSDDVIIKRFETLLASNNFEFPSAIQQTLF